MTTPSDVPAYSAVTFGPAGEQVARVAVFDTGDMWTYKFGLDGENIGLYTVNVSKFRVSHLNWWGALEVALRELDLKLKQHHETGMSLYSNKKTPEITDG